jgi:hypothetical protein
MSTQFDATDKLIDQLQKARGIEKVEFEGRTYFYFDKALHRPPIPRATSQGIFTLNGMVQFIARNEHGKDSFLHVISEKQVELVSGLFEEDCSREVYATACASAVLGQAFQFGNFYDCEDFIIKLMTLFDNNEDREAILRLTGNIEEASVRNIKDDGITQGVTIRQGITRVAEAEVPRVAVLKPFRTFREIDQPESPFIVRMKPGKEGGKPTIAIFECDGGAWKLEAIDRIRDFLVKRLTGNAAVQEQPPIAVIA